MATNAKFSGINERPALKALKGLNVFFSPSAERLYATSGEANEDCVLLFSKKLDKSCLNEIKQGNTAYKAADFPTESGELVTVIYKEGGREIEASF